MTTFDHAKALAYPMRPANTDADVIRDDIIESCLRSDERRVCWNCGGSISAGQTIRARFEIRRTPKKEPVRTMTRACALCCAAMARANEDGGASLRARQLPSARRAG